MASAINASRSIDTAALTRTLTVFDEVERVEDLVTCIPGFFESHFSNDTHTILGLMEPTSSVTVPALALCLRDLLTTCVPGTSRLDPMIRKGRLYACLVAIWHYAREYSDPGQVWKMPKYFRILFGNLNDILSADDDARAKIMTLCVSSLVAANVVNDIRRRAVPPWASGGELELLRDTFGSLLNPDLSIFDRGPAELASLATLFEGLKKVVPQDLPPNEIIGSVVSKTVNVLARGMMACLPDDLRIDRRWGSTASAIGKSRAILEKCLSAYQELRTTSHLEVPLRHRETLVERLKDLDAKLSQLAVQYHQQSPSQTHPEGGTRIVGIQIVEPILNCPVTRSPDAQAAPDLHEFA